MATQQIEDYGIIGDMRTCGLVGHWSIHPNIETIRKQNYVRLRTFFKPGGFARRVLLPWQTSSPSAGSRKGSSSYAARFSSAIWTVCGALWP